MNLSKNISVQKVKALTATGGTAVNSASVDMEGYEGVVFFGTMATANAGNSVNGAQSGDNSTFIDLAGTKVVPGDNNDVFMLDIYKPTKRYVRLEVVRAGADTVLGEIYALLYGPRVKPVSHGADIDSELHASPAEGTA